MTKSPLLKLGKGGVDIVNELGVRTTLNADTIVIAVCVKLSSSGYVKHYHICFEKNLHVYNLLYKSKVSVKFKS